MAEEPERHIHHWHHEGCHHSVLEGWEVCAYSIVLPLNAEGDESLELIAVRGDFVVFCLREIADQEFFHLSTERGLEWRADTFYRFKEDGTSEGCAESEATHVLRTVEAEYLRACDCDESTPGLYCCGYDDGTECDADG